MRRKLVLLFVASALWLPALHLWFGPGDPRELAPTLAARQRMLAMRDEGRGEGATDPGLNP